MSGNMQETGLVRWGGAELREIDRPVAVIVRRRQPWALDVAAGIIAACGLSAAFWLVVAHQIFR